MRIPVSAALASVVLVAVGLVAVGPVPLAAAQEIRIESVNGTDLEARGVAQLRRILETWDVARWTFVDLVLIESYVTPHSHPVLSLSTQYVREDERQLATFLHENFHWWVIRDEVDLDGAIAEFHELFPDAPGREGGGARDVDSTYLHLVVCDLEYRAISILLGQARAREVIEMWTHYPWVYERVLNDPRVHEVNARHGLVPPS